MRAHTGNQFTHFLFVFLSAQAWIVRPPERRNRAIAPLWQHSGAPSLKWMACGCDRASAC